MNLFLVSFALFATSIKFSVADLPLTLTLIHVNDLHARFEPVTAGPKSEDCNLEPKEKCIAGYARVVHAIRALKQKYHDDNPMLINAGDNFQGSIWYGFLRWNVTQAMLKLELPSLMVLGNHEFDHGVENLAKFLEYIDSPVVCANIKTRNEPAIDEKIAETLVREFNVKGQIVRVGFIGALYDKTNLTANTGKVEFRNAIESVKHAANELKNKGINKIIVVSHCGHSVDLQIAEEVGDLVDVIVGSHSHTLLWPKNYSIYPVGQEVVGEYPTIVHPKMSPERQVLLVQAFCHGKVVGAIQLFFDEHGEVKKFKPDPLYLDENYPQDEQVNKAMDIWRKEIEEIAKKPIGFTKVILKGKSCRWGECQLGSLLVNIFQKHYSKDSSEPILAFIQGASMKGDLSSAIITEGDLMRVYPFDSSVDIMEIEGKHIRRTLEKAATLDRKKRFNFLQISGFKVVYDMSRNEFERVISVKVDMGNNRFEPLLDDKLYKVVTSCFLANGGDNFSEIALNKKNYQIGPDSRDLIKKYLASHKISGNDVYRGASDVLRCPYCDEKKV
ncbi:apyrase-like [Culicoides brevitarsis]|uniref:apyrase-like n=1 Tax=Culicoides brevitarsis TaxID=469753 RepID=UPI00307B7456